jgi:hypothetical protein
VFTGFWWGNLRERDHMEGTAVDGRIILNGSSGIEMWRHGLNGAGSGYRQVAGTCKCGNEHSGCIKCGEILDQLRTG